MNRFFDQMTWFGATPLFPNEFDTRHPALNKVRIIEDSNHPNMAALTDGTVHDNKAFVTGLERSGSVRRWCM
jgi:hypothetical protein